MTGGEAAALTAIGTHLGSLYRTELAGRVRLGRLDRESRARWRAARKRSVTAVASSRWAGAITRAVEDQYQLGMRALAAHVADLRQAIEVLAARCALRPGELEQVGTGQAGAGGRSRRRRGYRSAAERFAKTRRLAVLTARLGAAEAAVAAGRPSITLGGKRLWRNRNHLNDAQMTERQWRDGWDAARMFLTADGESDKPGGNETIRVDEAGALRIKVPVALVDQLGTHITIATPVRFAHRGQEWMARVAARRAVRYDIHFDPDRGRWYLDASWTTTPDAQPGLDELRAGRVIGVDLNADHLAACVVDSAGNPVGDPITIEVATEGLPASRRDGRVRAAITALLDHAEQRGCGAIVVENLDFADARATGRDTLGRGARGKRLRRTVAAIPTAKFRTRLTAMAVRRGVNVIGVDAAYTSKWGNQHWKAPLQQQTSDPVTPPSRRGGRHRATWPRLGDQATAGRTPHRTADRCGHSTGQARPSPEDHTRVP